MREGVKHVVITSLQSPRVWKPRFPFRFSNPAHPDLTAMRRQERLDEVVGSQPSDWETVARLACWVNRRIPMDRREGLMVSPGQGRSGPALLQAVDQGCRGFACGAFSRLFVDALASFGILSRCMGVTATGIRLADSVGGVWNHAMAEVWLDSLGQWVLVDPELLIFYEHEGRRLSALELHQALLNGIRPKRRHFDDAQIEAWLAVTGLSLWREDHAEQFQMLGYDLDNDHCRVDFQDNAVRNGEERGTTHLVYWPDHAPWKPYFYPHLHYVVTNDPLDTSFPMNQVEIRLPLIEERFVALSAASGESGTDVELITFAPWFSSFLVRYESGGRVTDWQRVTGAGHHDGIWSATLFWPLHAGVNRLEARVVCAFDRLGPTARVTVERRVKGMG